MMFFFLFSLLLSSVEAKPAPAPAPFPQLTYASGIVVAATPPVVSGVSLPRGTGAFTGVPTVTGALTGSVQGTAISPRPPDPEATRYPSDGTLHAAQPAPFLAGGGLGTNGTAAAVNVQSDYDFQSVALLLYCDWLQLDMFETGLGQFSAQDFTDAGLTARDRALVQFLQGEVLGHVTLLTNILGRAAPTRCSYRYPQFSELQEFIDFAQKVSKIVESAAYSFIPHLDARATAQLLQQAISVTGRQQLILRQFEGLFPVPVWFQAAIPQSWAWSLIAPQISSCPGNNPRLVWQNYPPLSIVPQPNPFTTNATSGTGGGGGGNATSPGGAANGTAPGGAGGGGGGGGNTTSPGGGATNGTSSGGGAIGPAGGNTTFGPGIGSANISAIQPSLLCVNSTCKPSISGNRSTPLSQPGTTLQLSWSLPGSPTGPNNSYITTSRAGRPAFLAWVTQLNITYTPLRGVSGPNSTTAQTTQPDFATFAGDPGVNGTMFVAVTDADLFVTPFNLSLLGPHVVAGPAVYQAG